MSTDSPASYVPGCLVAYVPPTSTRGSAWRATITRGSGAADRFRARVPFAYGPDAAARAVVARFNECLAADWQVLGAALSLDGGTAYAYPVGPAHCAETLRA